MTLRLTSMAIFLLLTLLSLASLTPSNVTKYSDHEVEIAQESLSVPKSASISKPTLLESLHFYQSISDIGYMSSRDLHEFKSAIALAKELYPNVPSTLIFSTAMTESTLNPNVRHPNPSDHGICGINYTYNGDELKRAGIIEKESDLDEITPNVLSCAHLYNKFISKTNGKIKSAIYLYKGTNKGGRVDKLYALYRSDVSKVYTTQKSKGV